MRKLPAFILLVSVSPAFAGGGEKFLSLRNTEFVVLVGFLLFVGILLYFRIPSLVGGLLDKRAESIRAELDEAKALREEAQTLLASFERKQVEVRDQAARIVEHARTEAAEAAEKAREDLKASIARRLAAAEEQIASAEAAALREVRDSAIQVAVDAAREVIAAKMSAAERNRLVDEAIETVEKRLH